MDAEEILNEIFVKDFKERHETCKGYELIPTFSPLCHQEKAVELFFKSKYRGMLFYHTLGSGKTCTGIMIIDRYLNYYRKRGVKKNVYIITPGSLRENFIREYCSKCGISQEEEFGNFYFITSNDRGLIKNNRIPENFDNGIILIDEVHNIIRGVLNRSSVIVELYKRLYNSKNARFILLSGTPIYTNGEEDLYYILHLCKKGVLPLITMKKLFPKKKGEVDTIESLYKDDDILKMLNGVVSHVTGFGEEKYPKIISDELYTSELTQYQRQSYLLRRAYEINILNMSKLANNLGVNIDSITQKTGMSFLANSRFMSKQVLNFCYPTYIQRGLDKLEGEDPKNLLSDYPSPMWLGDVSDDMLKNEYSPKFYDIITNVQKYEGKHLIFSQFKSRSGVYLLYSLLMDKGIKCAMYTGDQNDKQKKSILEEYNNIENLYGGLLKVLLITAAGTEGVNLKACMNVHITEPSINETETDQAIGRAVRYESHLDLPIEKRTVRIFRYETKLDRSISESVLINVRDMSELEDYQKEQQRLGIDIKEDDMTFILLKSNVKYKKKDVFVSEFRSSDEECSIIGKNRKNRCLHILELMKKGSIECGKFNNVLDIELYGGNVTSSGITSSVTTKLEDTASYEKLKKGDIINDDKINHKLKSIEQMEQKPTQDYMQSDLQSKVKEEINDIENENEITFKSFLLYEGIEESYIDDIPSNFFTSMENIIVKQEIENTLHKLNLNYLGDLPQQQHNIAIRKRKREVIRSLLIINREQLLKLAYETNNYNIETCWINFYEILNYYDLIPNNGSTITHFNNDNMMLCSAVLATHHYINTKTTNKYKWKSVYFNNLLLNHNSNDKDIDDFDYEFEGDKFGLFELFSKNWINTNINEEGNEEKDEKEKIGDMTDIDNIYKVQQKLKSKVDLYTANINTFYLTDLFFDIVGKVLCGIFVLKIGGNMIIKVGKIYETPILSIIAILTTFFEYVYISKPISSDLSIPEVFLVCLNFLDLNDKFDLKNILISKLINCIIKKKYNLLSLNALTIPFTFNINTIIPAIYSLQNNYINSIVNISIKAIRNGTFIDNEILLDFMPKLTWIYRDKIYETCHLEKIKPKKLLNMKDAFMQLSTDYEVMYKIINFAPKKDENKYVHYKGDVLTEDEFDHIKKIENLNLYMDQYISLDNIPDIIHYRSSKIMTRPSIHLGQRKLLMSEVLFLTKYLTKPNMIIVYVGAAHGIHIPYLSYLFYDMKPKFILYDLGKFKLSRIFGNKIINETIEIRQEYFTDDSIDEFKDRDDVLFISDIRVADKYIFFELMIDQQMKMQMDWIVKIVPEASMVKFRFPFDALSEKRTKAYEYIDGVVYPQVWGGVATTETRLISSKEEIKRKVTYNTTQYDNKMYYLNTVIRKWGFYNHDININNVDGLDRCYDCALEIFIWKEYCKRMKIIDVQNTVADLMNKASEVNNRGLNMFPHGFKPNTRMCDKIDDIIKILNKLKEK